MGRRTDRRGSLKRVGVMIREGMPADLDALERIENAAFDADRLSRRSLRYFLAAATTDVSVAEVAEGLAGYAMIGFRRTSRTGRVFSLAVESGQGRRGIGRALLNACEAHGVRRGCRAVRLEVRADNTAAIRLYETSGYSNFGTYEDYYEDGAPALRFEKPLARAWMPAGAEG